MSFLNDRLFGSEIDPTLKVKLELRRFLNEGTKPFESVDNKLQELLGKNPTCKLKTVEDFGFSFSEQGLADLSSRVPFARMWTGVELVRSEIEETTLTEMPALNKKKSNESYYWDGEEVKVNKITPYDKMVYVIGTHHYNIFSSVDDINTTIGKNKNFGAEDTPPVTSRDILGTEFSSKNTFLKPPAGIKSIDIQSVGTSAAPGIPDMTKEITVQFVVHNFDDYDKIYSKYFLNPGAAVFIDYGWNTTDLYSPFELVKKSEVEIKEAIYGNDGFIAQSYGDLDVLIGVVKNFDAKVRDDGGVDCTLELISRGSLILGNVLKEENGQIEAILNKLETELVKFTLSLSQDRSDPGKDKDAKAKKIANNSKSKEYLKYLNEERPKATPVQLNAAAGLIGQKYLKQNQNDVFPGNVENSMLFGMYYSNATAAPSAFISIGLFEDLVINKFFGQGESLKKINSSENNLNSKFDSSTSFINTNDNLIQRQKSFAQVIESLPFLFPYPYNTDVTTITNTWTTINKNIAYEDVLKNITIGETDVFDKTKVIPIRECFIRLDIIVNALKSAVKNESNLSKAVTQILNRINKDFDDQIKLIIISDYASNKFKIIDANTLGIDVDKIRANAEFTFKPFAKNSIVKSLDFSYNLPDSDLGKQYALQSLPIGSEYIPLSSTIDKYLTETLLKFADGDDLVNSVGFRYLPYKDQYGSYNLVETKTDLFSVSNVTNKNSFTNISKVKDLLIIGTKSEITKATSTKKTEKKNNNKNDMVENTTKNVIVAKNIGEFYLLHNRINRSLPMITNFSLSLSTYGCSLFTPGDVFNVDYLPTRFREYIHFQIMGIKHAISPGSWVTSLETQVLRKKGAALPGRLYSTKEIVLNKNFLLNLTTNLKTSGLFDRIDTIKASSLASQTKYADFVFSIKLNSPLNKHQNGRIENILTLNAKQVDSKSKIPTIVSEQYNTENFERIYSEKNGWASNSYEWDKDIENKDIKDRGFKVENPFHNDTYELEFYARDNKTYAEANSSKKQRVIVFSQEFYMEPGSEYTLLIKNNLWVVVPKFIGEFDPTIVYNKNGTLSSDGKEIRKIQFYDRMLGVFDEVLYIIDESLLVEPFAKDARTVTDDDSGLYGCKEVFHEDNKANVEQLMENILPKGDGLESPYDWKDVVDENWDYQDFWDSPEAGLYEARFEFMDRTHHYHWQPPHYFLPEKQEQDFFRALACAVIGIKILNPEYPQKDAIAKAINSLYVQRKPEGDAVKYSEAVKTYKKNWYGDYITAGNKPAWEKKNKDKWNFGPPTDGKHTYLPSKWDTWTSTCEANYDNQYCINPESDSSEGVVSLTEWWDYWFPSTPENDAD